MLEIIVPGKEIYNESDNSFITIKETKLQLEHSLISVRKWESKWHKSFLETNEKTTQEILEYIKCMTINRGVDPLVYQFIPTDLIAQIVEYIKDPMTATWFTEKTTVDADKKQNETTITAEIIYYWMVSLNIPSEYEKWHLNQLLTLIKVVSIKSAGPQKMDKDQAAEMRRRINKERRKKHNSKG